MDGPVGRELFAYRRAVEWTHTDPRSGIRRIADGGDATQNDRAQFPVWDTCVPLAAGAQQDAGDLHRLYSFGAGHPGRARRSAGVDKTRENLWYVATGSAYLRRFGIGVCSGSADSRRAETAQRAVRI